MNINGRWWEWREVEKVEEKKKTKN